MTIFSEELIEDSRFYTWLSTDPKPGLTSGWAPKIGDMGYEKDTNRVYQWSGVRWDWRPHGTGIAGKSSGAFDVVANGTTDNVNAIAAIILVPGGLLKESSKWEFDCTWSYPATANQKILNLHHQQTTTPGAVVSTATVSSGTAQSSALHIKGWNAGSLGAQRWMNNPTGPASSSNNAIITQAIDTSRDSYFIATAKWNLANAAGETITLEEYDLRVTA